MLCVGCCHTLIERITRLWGNRSEELGGNLPFTARSAIRYSGCVMDTERCATSNPSTYQLIDPGSQSTPYVWNALEAVGTTTFAESYSFVAL